MTDAQPKVMQPRHVTIWRDAQLSATNAMAAAATYTLRGSTPHFSVSYDPTLGADGITIADGILSTCEADFKVLQVYFGGITPPGMPFKINVIPGNEGAYHFSCDGVDLFIEAQSANGLNIPFMRSLVVAEEDEVFEEAVGRGWGCGASNGEGLSRVLANDMYPGIEPAGFVSAPVWLDTVGRPDWVSQTEATDQNYVSIGCAVLFLNWLRFQLGYSWTQIIAAGGSTLGQTYSNLTGRNDGLSRFKALLQTRYPEGRPSGLTVDNPFPLPGLTTKVTLSDTSSTSPALTSHNGNLFLAWKGDGNDNLNVSISNDGGASFGGKFTFTDTSDHAPTLASHNGNLYLGWKGDGNGNLNVAIINLVQSSSGLISIQGLSSKVTLTDTSDTSPVLASYNGDLYLGWKGSGNDSLNVMVSHDNGATFGGKATFREDSSEAPTLTSHNGSLYLGWKGSGNTQLNVAQVTIIRGSSASVIQGLSNKVTLSDTSDKSPALASANQRLYLVWKGSGNDSLSIMYSADNGATFTNKILPGENSSVAPTITTQNNQLYLGWKGSGNDLLNVATIVD